MDHLLSREKRRRQSVWERELFSFECERHSKEEITENWIITKRKKEERSRIQEGSERSFRKKVEEKKHTEEN